MILKVKNVLILALLSVMFLSTAQENTEDLVQKEISKMMSLPTTEIVDGIIPVYEGFVNMYLIKVADKYIAVDAGMKVENITKELKQAKINPDDVVALFLTHTDFDHTGGLHLFKNAQIYISRAEEQMINGSVVRMDTSYNSIPKGYKMLKDREEVVVLGHSVKGVLTPGHTPGSMSYFVDNKHLFVGDALGLRQGKAGLFSDLFNMNTKQQMKSLNILKELKNVEYLFTAHFGYTKDFKKAFRGL